MYRYNPFHYRERLSIALIMLPVALIVFLLVSVFSDAAELATYSSFLSKLKGKKAAEGKPDPKVQAAVVKIQTLFADEAEVRDLLIELLQSKNASKLIKNYQKQVMGWIEAKEKNEASFEYPLSEKQFAWTLYILHPGKYPNPKKDKTLYPDQG